MAVQPPPAQQPSDQQAMPNGRTTSSRRQEVIDTRHETLHEALTQLAAATVTRDEAEEDILRSNPTKNIVIISMPTMTNAEKYNSIRKLRVGDAIYETVAYTVPPEDTVKGVIHRIPSYNTAEDITRSAREFSAPRKITETDLKVDKGTLRTQRRKGRRVAPVPFLACQTRVTDRMHRQQEADIAPGPSLGSNLQVAGKDESPAPELEAPKQTETMQPRRPWQDLEAKSTTTR
ncbi:hypothetical protein HPB48_020247 [Haemaphysalis longicornis]|uniref:Uncharacterized protein n=1 Tax=Haemaphysalis longicornis TaxID=44386 RepID=A0A9J6H267_HAELO|nr:hypothetical protein HPB48_020247 [Haemaphysalis longicornis]